MRHNFFRALSLSSCLGILSFFQIVAAAITADSSNKPNFSGSWTLDVGASTSIDPLMRYIEAGLLDRIYVACAKLKANLHQNGDLLTIATSGPGFVLDQTLYLDGRTNADNVRLFGATSVSAKTTWSKDYKQLVEIHQIKTTQGKDGQLTIVRSLTDQGNSLVVVLTVQLNSQPDKLVARQLWRKEASAASSQ
jgi:hypothetical protein